MTEAPRRFKAPSMTLEECRLEHHSTLPQRPGYEWDRAPRVRRGLVEVSTGDLMFDYTIIVDEFDEQTGERHFAPTPTLAIRVADASYEDLRELVDIGEITDTSVDKATPESIRAMISAIQRSEVFRD